MDEIDSILQSTNPKSQGADNIDIPSFCKSATLDNLRQNNYLLTPGRYIDFKEVEEDGQAFAEKMQMLTSTLSAQMQKANELDEAIKIKPCKNWLYDIGNGTTV